MEINEKDLQTQTGEENPPVEKKKSNKKRNVIIAVILILFLALLGYRLATNVFMEEEPEAKTPVNVKVTTAVVGDIYVEAPITAKIEAADEAAIVPLMAGRITSVKVKEGDHVSKGDVLFTIDDTQAANSLAQASEALNLAKTNFERMEFLYNEGVISQAEYDSANSQYISAQLNYNSAAQAASYYTVTAPISGYITSLDAKEGSVAGQTMMGMISDISKLEINMNVTESMASKISVGDSVNIYISSLDKTLTGRVSEFNKIPETGKVTYPVKVIVNGSNKELIAGMFAEVRIKSEHNSSAIIVPSESVIVKNGEASVVILDGKMPVITPVETGIDNGVQVEIISGVNEGDTVVVSGQQYVTEGEEVNIID